MRAGLCIGLGLAASLIAAQADAVCIRAVAPVPSEAVPAARDFLPAVCDTAPVRNAFRHDAQTGGTRTARAIAAGEILVAYPEFGSGMIMPGQSLKLAAHFGAATVIRQVEAVQAALPGQRLFVRDAGGNIFAVRYEDAQR